MTEETRAAVDSCHWRGTLTQRQAVELRDAMREIRDRAAADAAIAAAEAAAGPVVAMATASEPIALFAPWAWLAIVAGGTFWLIVSGLL